jgi:hypothetical protein
MANHPVRRKEECGGSAILGPKDKLFNCEKMVIVTKPGRSM